MPQTQVHAGMRPGIRAVRLLASLAGALAAACCASACASGTASTVSGKPSSQAQGGAAISRSTPGAALEDWMHQVVRGNYGAACQDMRDPALSARRSAAACMSAKGVTALAAWHGNFTIDGIRPSTPISAAAHVTGTNATVSASDVHVSGTTLVSLIVAHSTGIKPGQLTITFELSRIHGVWYVTNMSLDVKTNVNMNGRSG